MGDNLRWFKVWVSVANAFHAQGLSMEQIGRWTILGALTAEIGHNGELVYDAEKLKNRLELVTVEETVNALNVYENVSAKYDENGNGKIIVTFGKWSKYQMDSTASKRQAEFKKRKKGNGLRGEERRGDFKEEVEVNSKIVFSLKEKSFINITNYIPTWQDKFPAVNIEQELKKMEAWILANPKNRKSNYQKFIVNWLIREQDKARPERNRGERRI